MGTLILSPEFMNRSAGLGVKVSFTVDSSGLAGPVELPLVVMKAKLTYSRPAAARQAGLLSWPAIGSLDRLSMLSAAHHLVGSQLVPPTARAAGHLTHPGG